MLPEFGATENRMKTQGGLVVGVGLEDRQNLGILSTAYKARLSSVIECDGAEAVALVAFGAARWRRSCRVERNDLNVLKTKGAFSQNPHSNVNAFLLVRLFSSALVA